MESNQIMALAEQYAREGKDLAAFILDYNTMAASGKTALGLNQWIKSDKPTMDDFNEDNRIIDERLRELSETKADRGILDSFTVQLQTGITALVPISCTKNAFGEIILTGAIEQSTAFVRDQLLILLPSELSPLKRTTIPCISNPNNIFQPTLLALEPNGRFTTATWGGTTFGTRIFFNATYAGS